MEDNQLSTKEVIFPTQPPLDHDCCGSTSGPNVGDTLLSSLLDPLEGLTMLSCRKLELGGHFQFLALKGVRGAC
jgi:hypothetical protein